MSTQDPTPPPHDGAGATGGYAGSPVGGDAPRGGASPTGGPRNGLGLAALIVGIATLVLSWIPFEGFLGAVAVILGIVALGRVRKGVATNRGMALAGVILGALAVVVAILWVVFTVIFANTFGGTIQDCMNVPAAQQEQCVEDSLGG